MSRRVSVWGARLASAGRPRAKAGNRGRLDARGGRSRRARAGHPRHLGARNLAMPAERQCPFLGSASSGRLCAERHSTELDSGCVGEAGRTTTLGSWDFWSPKIPDKDFAITSAVDRWWRGPTPVNLCSGIGPGHCRSCAGALVKPSSGRRATHVEPRSFSETWDFSPHTPRPTHRPFGRPTVRPSDLTAGRRHPERPTHRPAG